MVFRGLALVLNVLQTLSIGTRAAKAIADDCDLNSGAPIAVSNVGAILDTRMSVAFGR